MGENFWHFAWTGFHIPISIWVKRDVILSEKLVNFCVILREITWIRQKREFTTYNFFFEGDSLELNHCNTKYLKKLFQVNFHHCHSLYFYFSHRSLGRLKDLVAEHLDHLHYLNDILCLRIENLNEVLTDHLLNRLFIPLYIYSLVRNPVASNSLEVLF